MNASRVLLPPDGVIASGCLVVSVGCDSGGALSGGSDGSVVTTLEPGYTIKHNNKIQVFSRSLCGCFCRP